MCVADEKYITLSESAVQLKMKTGTQTPCKQPGTKKKLAGIPSETTGSDSSTKSDDNQGEVAEVAARTLEKIQLLCLLAQRIWRGGSE